MMRKLLRRKMKIPAKTENIVRLSLIVVCSFLLYALPVYSEIVPCPIQEKTQDIFDNDPGRKCLTEDTQMQGYLLPKGSKVLLFPSGKLKVVKLPKDRPELKGVKWAGWIDFDEKSGKLKSGYLRVPVELKNGATIGRESSVTVTDDGQIPSGKLAKPYTFRGFHIPAGVMIVFWPNGNVREVFVDQESHSVRDPKGDKYGPPASLQFSEEGKFIGFQENG